MSCEHGGLLLARGLFSRSGFSLARAYATAVGRGAKMKPSVLLLSALHMPTLHAMLIQ